MQLDQVVYALARSETILKPKLQFTTLNFDLVLTRLESFDLDGFFEKTFST